ncbi:unnamed protein product [Nesidiocoris tenuis]|uniref:Uncharacterized protein n=1 Tax=Nesidiocoris tenuis TaxID=355587 RepID=A0A6H5GGZ8_9HEMI|nr:unnamed protein product [Nesidiocoris tenuis]
MARRGVALDKQPGVRPIGVGEVLHRICSKTDTLTGDDQREAVCADQLCRGAKAGVEGAVHGLQTKEIMTAKGYF